VNTRSDFFLEEFLIGSFCAIYHVFFMEVRFAVRGHLSLYIWLPIHLRFIYIYIFFLPFPFHLTGLSGTFYGRLGFFFPLWCGGAPGYFPRLPTPTLSPLLFLDDTTRISQHTTSMGGHPAWDLNPADLAVVSGECRSSFHHPTVSPY
jgi:hypothetical protein